MAVWKAFGDSAFVLLFLTLAIGPLVRLWKGFAAAIPWRNQTGVWFGLMALIHGLLIWNGWARWDVARFFGYEFIPELGRLARWEPGFGLANTIGMVALLWALVLLATSTERALTSLGGSSWKWLHHTAHTIFYLSAIHAAYFLFIHYTVSFHKAPPPPDWFRGPLLVMVGTVLALQVLAFRKTVRERGRSAGSAKARA